MREFGADGRAILHIFPAQVVRFAPELANDLRKPVAHLTVRLFLSCLGAGRMRAFRAAMAIRTSSNIFRFVSAGRFFLSFFLSNSDHKSHPSFTQEQMQKTLSDAKKYDELSVHHTLGFWVLFFVAHTLLQSATLFSSLYVLQDVLLSTQPELNRLNDLAELLNATMISAFDSFRRLMRLSGGNSIPVLRMYAGFLLDVANESDQGREYLTRAEELEDQQSKDHSEGALDGGGVGPTLDDRHAIVSISADMKKLGQVCRRFFVDILSSCVRSTDDCFVRLHPLCSRADSASQCNRASPAGIQQVRDDQSQREHDHSSSIRHASPGLEYQHGFLLGGMFLIKKIVFYCRIICGATWILVIARF